MRSSDGASDGLRRTLWLNLVQVPRRVENIQEQISTSASASLQR
ncbi:hypothetical protein [Nostoc sp. UHCC 0302]